MGKIGSKLVQNMKKGEGGSHVGGSFAESHELSGEEQTEDALEKVCNFPALSWAAH